MRKQKQRQKPVEQPLTLLQALDGVTVPPEAVALLALAFELQDKAEWLMTFGDKFSQPEEVDKIADALNTQADAAWNAAGERLLLRRSKFRMCISGQDHVDNERHDPEKDRKYVRVFKVVHGVYTPCLPDEPDGKEYFSVEQVAAATSHSVQSLIERYDQKLPGVINPYLDYQKGATNGKA